MYKLALIIPCFNEEKRIGRTLEGLADFFKSQPAESCVVIVVDDGSTDHTADAVREAAERIPELEIKYVSLAHNSGKGAAIKYGVTVVEAEVYGFTDADLSIDPKHIPQALELLNQVDLVIGERPSCRVSSGYSRLRTGISNLISRAVRRALGVKVRDTQCGFKFFRRCVATDLFPSLQQDRFSFDLELVVQAQAAGFAIRSLPVEFKHAAGSTVRWQDGVRFGFDFLAIYDRLPPINHRAFVRRLFIAAGIVTAVCFGWVVCFGYFFSDDFTWLWFGKRILENLSNIYILRAATFFSPVMNTLMAVMYRVFGSWAPPYFIFGLLMHALVSGLLGLFVHRVTRSRLAAWFAALAMAMAGGAYEPLVWFGATIHLIAAFFIMVCVLTALMVLQGRSSRWLILSLASFLLALITKESAVILPALLLGLVFLTWRERRSWPRPWIVGLSAGVTALVSAAYFYLQYWWQIENVAVKSGLWQIRPEALWRLPTTFLSIFTSFDYLLQTQTAWFFTLLGVLLFVYILWTYRKIRLVWYGLGWTLCACAPTLFFLVPHWWEPLASRYSYLPRLGVVMVLAVIFERLVRTGTKRRFVNGFLAVILLATVSQFVMMARAVSTEYAYVYKTGRSLAYAASLLRLQPSRRILVAAERPFRDNDAYILGALDVYGNVDASRVKFFHGAEQPVKESKDDLILDWDAERRDFVLR